MPSPASPTKAPPLPIEAVLDDLRQALRQSPAIVLEAAPGAGKTTRVPLALLDEEWLAGRRIVMLEPRRLAARLAAAYMAESLLGEAVGNRVGYRVRFDSQVGRNTRVEVVTEGILTRMLQDDPELAGVGLLIFDEFHERNLVADLGLALALDVQQALRPDLRILVMSATLDGERLAAFLGDAPLLRCPGRAWPVDTFHVPLSRGDDVVAAAVRVARRALAETPGGVLVFLPGSGEIRRAEGMFKASPPPPGTTVYPLHGTLAWELQQQAVAASPPGERKVVLATSIAETSLTIDGITAVVDAGLMRTAQFDPGSGMTRLVTGRVCRDAADQRRGRAGRLGPGTCWRLWSPAEEAAMAPCRVPEIRCADLADLALELAVWGIADPASLRWLEPPAPAAFRQARQLLEWLEALDRHGRATPHGRRMAALGAPARLAHLMLKADELACPALGAALAALLAERDIVSTPPGRRAPADLRLRLDALRHGAGHAPPLLGCTLRRDALARVRQAGDDFARRLGCQPRNWPANAVDQVGTLVALAYPDRIARRRGAATPGYLLSGGRGAILEADDGLAREEFLAVATTDGRPEITRIFTAAPLDRASLEQQFAHSLRVEEQVEWDAERERVVARRATRLGALTVAEEPLAKPPPEQVAQALLAGLRAAGLRVLPWSRDTQEWRARIDFLRRLDGPDSPWPDLGDQALLDSLDSWLAPWLAGMTRLTDLRRLDLAAILANLLPYALHARLDREAPTHLAVPSGSRVRLDYGAGETPVLAVKLQEMFGQAETPRLAGGRVAVLVHLLAPGRQPVQVTRDLANFWRETYFHVRKEWRGRYPKHPWPDNPATAIPTRKTTAQLARQG